MNNIELLMRFVVEKLHYTPEEFWQMTLKELQMIYGQAAQGEAISRTELEEMRKLFPDEKFV